MSFFAYIVCWDSVHQNVLNIENEFIKNSIPHKIINSGFNKKDNWINVGDIRYYRQFIKAVQDFDINYEYMLFLCGDVSYENWNAFIERSKVCLSTYDLGLYAPHLTHEPWSENTCKISEVNVDKNINIAVQTDGIVVFIKKDIVLMLKEFFKYLESKIDISTMTSGWGLDLVWCSYAIHNNMAILRDKKNILNHPAGSSYDHGKATEECSIILSNFYEFAKSKKWDADELMLIKDKIYGRMSHSDNCSTISDFYKNFNIYKNNYEIKYHTISINDERKENKDLIDFVLNNKNKINIESLNAKNEKDLDKFYKDNPEFKFGWNGFKLGEIGNFGSHYNAWKYLINSNFENIIIFEDDCLIDEKFIEYYKTYMPNVPKDYDVFSIYIDANQYPRYESKHYINEYISLGYQDWSTLCYVVSKKGAEKLCNYLKDFGMDRPTDWFIFRGGHEGKFNVYSLNPETKVPVSIDGRYTSQVQ